MGEEEHMEDRRRTDAVATAVAIESVRGDIKALTEKVGGFTDLVNQQIKDINNDHRVVNLSLKDLETEIVNQGTRIRTELMEHITSHKIDPVPHPESLGTKISSLESSRVYMRGMLAVGALAMPAITGLVFKWLGIAS